MPSWPSVLSLTLEREAEGVEEGLAFGIGLGGRHDRDVHASGGIDRVVVDLREDELVVHPERVVAAAVEGTGVEAAEVADARDGQADQPVEELPHASSPQGDLRADGVALAQLEVGDRLAGLGDHRLLAGDRGEVLDGAFEQRRLPDGGADAHVDHDLLEPRHLHDVGEAELVLEGRADLVVVAGLEPRHRVGGLVVVVSLTASHLRTSCRRAPWCRPCRSCSRPGWPCRTPGTGAPRWRPAAACPCR